MLLGLPTRFRKRARTRPNDTRGFITGGSGRASRSTGKTENVHAITRVSHSALRLVSRTRRVAAASLDNMHSSVSWDKEDMVG